jgi:hypothetical protein
MPTDEEFEAMQAKLFGAEGKYEPKAEEAKETKRKRRGEPSAKNKKVA